MPKEQIFTDLIDDIAFSKDATWTNLIEEDYHVKVFEDMYPCTPGHLLFVPKYNTVSILTDAFEDAVRWGQSMVDNGECEGFNIGLNYGEVAGQTVKWPHVHLIPRRAGDVKDPIGGVRNVIPGKGNYKK